MKDKIAVKDIAEAIGTRLNTYRSETAQHVFTVTKSSIRQLVKLTRQRAPRQRYVGSRKATHRSGTFARAIRSTVEDNGIIGAKGIWYVKAPEYRLTHLLVHGHQLRQGGRARGSDFLETSVDEVTEEFIKGLKEASKGD